MRSLVILYWLGPIVLSILRDRRRFLWWGRPAARTRHFHERRARRLVDALTHLGPTFIKLGQVFAGRADVIPSPYNEALATLTDQVRPLPYAVIAQVIQESYGREVDQLFEDFDREPEAAASLGQVHRAHYHGKQVAVKVLRPGVHELVARDVAAARWILGHVARWFDNPHVRALRVAVDEFALRIPEEMDFRLEASNAIEVHGFFSGHPRIRIPEVVRELVTERVLVLEYLEGTRIDALQDRIARGEFPAAQVIRQVLEAYLEMMLVRGFFHADPHPGNLLVGPRGELVILDFGMVIRVPIERRRQIVEAAFAAVFRDLDALVKAFNALGFIEPGTDPSALRSLAAALLRLADQRTTTIERLEYLSQEVLTTLYDWPVVLPGDLVYFSRTAGLIEGLGVRYDPQFNALLVATPVLLELRPRIVAAIGPTPSIDWATQVGTLLGRASRILGQAGRDLGALLGEQLGKASAVASALRALRHSTPAAPAPPPAPTQAPGPRLLTGP